MADIKISGLTAATAPDLDDELEIVEDGSSRRATVAQIIAAAFVNTAPTLGWYSPSADTIRTPNSVIIDDNLTASGAGPHAIGGGASASATLNLAGNQAVTGPDGATLRIAAPSTGATSNFSLWVDSGNTRLDGDAIVGGLITSARGGEQVRLYGAATGGHQWDIYGSGNNLRISDNTGGGSLVIDQSITASSLAGTGTRAVVVDANGVMSAP